MQKRISKPKRPRDVNEWAHKIGSESTREDAAQDGAIAPVSPAQISLVMAKMGRRGGRIGGKRRLEKLSAERRREIALKAARARWDRRSDTPRMASNE